MSFCTRPRGFRMTGSTGAYSGADQGREADMDKKREKAGEARACAGALRPVRSYEGEDGAEALILRLIRAHRKSR